MNPFIHPAKAYSSTCAELPAPVADGFEGSQISMNSLSEGESPLNVFVLYSQTAAPPPPGGRSNVPKKLEAHR